MVEFQVCCCTLNPHRFIILPHKEQVVFHLPTELDGRDLLPMPSTEGNVVVVDVPVASLYLAQ